jgi:hypothetical protein
MEVKDKFDLLYESLKDEFKGYIDFLMKTWTFIIITMGWILTSQQSREFLAKQRAAYWWLLATILVIYILHVGVCNSYYRRSQNKFNLLIREFSASDSPYIEKEYYISYKITPLLVWTNLLLSLFLFAVLFMIVLSL